MGPNQTVMRVASILIVSAIAVLIYWSVAAGRPDEKSTHASASASSKATKEVKLLRSSPDNLIKGDFSEEAVNIIRDLEQALDGLPSTPAMPATASKSYWPGSFLMTDFDLPQYCFEALGNLEHEKLVRHVELNPLDAPLCERQVEHLGVFIATINEHLEKLKDHYKAVRREEMRAAIKSGKVKPSPVEEVPSYLLRTLAKSSMREGKHPGKTMDEVMKIVAKENTHIPSNSYVHKGRIYPHTSFKNLPRTDELFGHLQFFSYDAFGGITEWFLANGCLTTKGQRALMSRGTEFSRLDLAKRGPM